MPSVFSLIDRYISRAFLTNFLMGLTVFITLFLAVDFISNISRFEVGMETLASYYGSKVFWVLHMFLPVACLVGVVFTLSTLNKNRELTALFSMGMSLWRVLTPIFVIVAVLVLLSFFLGDQILPQAKQNEDYIYYVEMKKTPGLYSTVKTNKIWYRSDNIIFNIRLLEPEQKKAFGVTLYYFSPKWQLQQLIVADEAVLKKREWELSDGNVTIFVEDFTTPLTKSFDSKTIAMTEELSDLKTTGSASDFLSFRELGNYIEKNKEAGLDMTRFEVDYHNKLSFPFMILVMALLGVPFVIAHDRAGGRARNVGLVMVMTFIYYTAYNSGMALGKHGYLPPIFAAWGPNMVIMAVTALLFRFKRA